MIADNRSKEYAIADTRLEEMHTLSVPDKQNIYSSNDNKKFDSFNICVVDI